MSYSLFIPQGTKVLGKGGIVTLRAEVFVEGATRGEDGAYRYAVAGKEYLCSAACCQAVEEGPVRHKDGLVWMG